MRYIKHYAIWKSTADCSPSLPDITISSCIVNSRISDERKRIWRGIKSDACVCCKNCFCHYENCLRLRIFFCTRRNHKWLDVCGMEECIKQRGVKETTQTEFPIFRLKPADVATSDGWISFSLMLRSGNSAEKKEEFPLDENDSRDVRENIRKSLTDCVCYRFHVSEDDGHGADLPDCDTWCEHCELTRLNTHRGRVE